MKLVFATSLVEIFRPPCLQNPRFDIWKEFTGSTWAHWLCRRSSKRFAWLAWNNGVLQRPRINV